MDAPAELPVTLGVLDWGIGGYGFVRRLLDGHPRADFVYLSDAGFTPYGQVPARALRARVELAARFLAELGASHLVVACNAASTVVPEASFPDGLCVSDVVTYGVAAASATPGVLGIVGGYRTIRSGAYARPLRASGRAVVARVAQPLSAHVERGALSGDRVEADVRRIVAPLRRVDALVLACTHYPAIQPLLARALPGVVMIDPVDALVAAVARAGLSGGATARHFTTGDPVATARAAALAFGVAARPIPVARDLPVRDVGDR
jgi:glutamate racemase